MEEHYNPGSIEKKWAAAWDKSGLYTVPNSVAGKENYYQLVEFSYPSGNLHVGHWYAFAVPDIHARFQRMKGKNVLYPMGFDAFGLPAENAAIKNNRDPKEWTIENIDYMRGQLKRMGAMFDWSREVITCDPNYYRWTQWLFIQLFNAGLVEQKETLANWCPNDKTVLANEQVINGNCDRCGAVIEKRVMKQWQLGITKYADRLLNDMDASTEKRHYVSLHGFTGNPQGNFHPWLKSELEKRGHTVEVPSLPDTDDPEPMKQVQYVLENCHFDESTVLIGHSLGSAVALKVAEALDQKLKKLVLVAGFNTPKFRDKPRSFENKFDWNFDFEKIKSHAEKIDILSAKNDSAVGPEHGKILAEKLNGKLIEFQAEGDHVCGLQEPRVLQSALEVGGLDWPEEIKTSQRNWIGKSEGAEISFPLKFIYQLSANDNRGSDGEKAALPVFTTRPDTLFGATYLVLAPEHLWVTLALRDDHDVLENKEEIRTYVQEAIKKTEIERSNTAKEKTGVLVKGVVAINPASGKEIPIYIADYVLAGYGTGAVMAVPAHDERDNEFAKKFNLPIKQVIFLRGGSEAGDWDGKEQIRQSFEDEWNNWYSKEGLLMNSGEFDGLDSESAKQKITEHVGGKMVSTYRLRDWGVSRQRYWGCPIPLVHCEACGWQTVLDDQLPVVLPEVSDYLPNDEGQSPLSKNPEFVNTICPKCSGKATRETDTLDTFVDSSWYFLRYCDADNEKTFADKEMLKSWLPIHLYSGGAEHTTMHLLYSRFFHKALFDLGLVNEAEPYTRRLNRGLILGPDGNKMSKSKGNVVDPDAIVAELGADTMRMYLAFIGPYNETGSYPWNPEGVIGVHRYLERVWKLTKKVSTESNADAQKIESVLYKTLHSVEESLTSFKMNTGVAALMSCSNELKTFPTFSPEHMRFYARMLAPYAPYIAEELWNMFGGEGSVHENTWPIFDATKVVQETLKMAVQVNGKMRTVIEVTLEMSEKEIQELALQDEKVQSAIDGKEIKKIIIVPEKVVNVVVS